MTEKEAWLEVAEMFDSARPTWHFRGVVGPINGICDALLHLANEQSRISCDVERVMIVRLGEYFNPNGKNVWFEFFWPDNHRRTSRTLRATACCFLAAMCDLP